MIMTDSPSTDDSIPVGGEGNREDGGPPEATSAFTVKSGSKRTRSGEIVPSSALPSVLSMPSGTSLDHMTTMSAIFMVEFVVSAFAYELTVCMFVWSGNCSI